MLPCARDQEESRRRASMCSVSSRYTISTSSNMGCVPFFCFRPPSSPLHSRTSPGRVYGETAALRPQAAIFEGWPGAAVGLTEMKTYRTRCLSRQRSYRALKRSHTLPVTIQCDRMYYEKNLGYYASFTLDSLPVLALGYLGQISSLLSSLSRLPRLY